MIDQACANISWATEVGYSGDFDSIRAAADLICSYDQKIIWMAQPAPSQMSRCSNAMTDGIFLKNEFAQHSEILPNGPANSRSLT